MNCATTNCGVMPRLRAARFDTHVAPLGLGRRLLSPGYKHVAPLGLNEPMHRLPFHFPSCKSFNPACPACPDLSGKILIQTIIMNTPQLDLVFPFSRFPASVCYHIIRHTACQGWIRDPTNSKELLDGINPTVV